MGDDTYVRTTTEPYHVEYWGPRSTTCWVMARNGVTVATCQNARTARRIAALLNRYGLAAAPLVSEGGETP